MKVSVEDFNAQPANQDEFNEVMQKMINLLQTELDNGTLHGIAVVRVNQGHEVAGGLAICADSASVVADRLQEMSMDLKLPPELASAMKRLFASLRSHDHEEEPDNKAH